MLKNIAKSQILIAVLIGVSIYLATSQPLPAFAAGSSVGGIYTKNIDGTCRHSNLFAGNLCKCPEGFKDSIFDKFDNPTCWKDIYRDGTRTIDCGTETHQCTKNSVSGPDGGIYSTNYDGTCNHENPYTNECECPADFDKFLFDQVDNPSCLNSNIYSDGNGSCGIKSYQCKKGSVDLPTGGIYMKNISSPETCRHKNPYTGDCSCPNGFTPSVFKEFSAPGCPQGFYYPECSMIAYQCINLTPPPPPPPIIAPKGGLIPCGRLDIGNDPTNIDMSQPCGLCAVFYLFKKIINFITALTVGIGVFILILAGLLYALSAGDSHKIELAKSAVTSALIGIAIISVAWLVIAAILQGMGYANIGTWSQVSCPLPLPK